MQTTIEVLEESRNSLAMAKARYKGDFAAERLLMDQVEDPYKFVMAQNALIYQLLTIINLHSNALRLENIKAMNANDVLEIIIKRLAQESSLIIDVDTDDVS